jgi:hypothetical protein
LAVLGVVLESADAVDIPVDTEAEYAVLLDAIRATEYTRQGYLEGQANPRMVASVAGLWAFAERNPLATPEQLAAFVVAYDGALAQIVPGDERLTSAGSVLTALNAARVASDGVLDGTDTRVGRRAMELVGVSLPGLESFDQSQLRMARFDLGSVQRWINRSETADALTGVLAGVDPTGNRVDGLAAVAAAYLESLGYTPMLGTVDPAQIEVNAGLAGLPDFAGFVAIRDDAGAHATLEAEVFGAIGDIQTDAEDRLAAIGTAEIPDDLGLNSVAIFAAAADPDHPDHAVALQFLEDRRQAVVDSIRQTSDDRAAVFARTMLLRQSAYPDVVYAAENARSFAGMQLQVNNELAVAQQSLAIVGSLGELGAAYATGNVFAGVTATANLVSGVLGLADLLGDGPPSVDQQIFDQITALRQQVEDLRVQMNARFDIVDAKLDAIYDTMITAFGLLQDGINTLLADIATVRSSLDRIEAALFGFAQNLLLVDLTAQTDAVLDYRAKTGFDLAYSDQTPSFVGGASGLTTFATFTAQTSAFAGPDNNAPMSLTLDNASDLLAGDAVVSRLLNDFRRVPPGLVTTDGTPVVGPIISGRTAAPAPWSQAAAAYAQLSRESPWYFAYMLRNQQDAGGGNPAQIEQIIDQGERIALLAEATRGRDDLFNALLQRASDGMVETQAAIGDLIDLELSDRGFMNSNARIDPWGPLGQTASPLIAAIVDVNLDGFSASRARLELISLSDRGYEISVSDHPVGSSAASTRDELIGRNVLDRLIRGTTNRPLVALEDRLAEISPGSSNEFTMEVFIRLDGSNQSVRTIRVVAEVLDDQFGQGLWGPPVNPVNNGGTWGQMANSAWISFSGGNFQFTMPLGQGDLVGQTFPVQGVRLSLPFPLPGFYEVDARLRVISDTSSYESTGADYYNVQTQLLTNEFSDLRSGIRSKVFADLGSPSTPLGIAAKGLDDASSLLDGYLTLGASDAFGRSEVLRSALRGVPDSEGLGFRSGDLAEVIAKADAGDVGSLGGAPGVDLPTVGDHFAQRIAAVGSEVALALDAEAPSFPYVEFVLGELRDLRDGAFELAVDDTYLVSGTLSVDAAAGLMANDVGQPGRIDNEELMIDLAFLGSPDAIEPANGSVTVFADGSFQYTPDPGFEGTDSFTYRLVAEVGDPANPIGDPNLYSVPATVVVRVSALDCPADFTGDGLLNFFDFAAFIAAYQAQDPAADFNGDALFNFFDFPAFIDAFNAGCP